MMIIYQNIFSELNKVPINYLQGLYGIIRSYAEIDEQNDNDSELKQMLDDRVSHHKAHGDDAVSWDKLKQQYEQKYGYKI